MYNCYNDLDYKPRYRGRCTRTTLDIVARVPGIANVLAIDLHQNISYFRNVIKSNALTAIQATQVRSLPRPFRFGPDVADTVHSATPAFMFRS